MEFISYAFFVTETEYPNLQAACPDDFPFSYTEFVARVDQGIEAMADTAPMTKAYVRVDEFLAWCAESKVRPDNKSRAQYAIIIGQRQGLH